MEWEDVGRIRGLIRIIFRGETDYDYDEILDLVLWKLTSHLGYLGTPALWRLVHDAGIDYFRQKRKKPTQVELPPGLSVPMPTAKPRRPFLILKARLSLIYDDEKHRPHEALAFGYHSHFGYMPEDIRREHGDSALQALAQPLPGRYAAVAAVPVAEIIACFAQILSICGQPAGASILKDYWCFEDAIDLWIQHVEEEVEPENPNDSPDFSAAFEKPPNRRMAFALGSRFGLAYDSVRIAKEFGELTLGEIANRLEMLYPNAPRTGGISREDWISLIKVAERGANRQLASYYNPTRAIGYWIEAVKRRLETENGRQERLGLKEMFEFRNYSAEGAMAALYASTNFLHCPAANLLRDNNTLHAVEKELERMYAEKWGFKAEAVARWFRPLADQLKRERKDNDHVTRYFPNVDSVSRRSREVLGPLRQLVKGGRHLPLFAWRHNLL